MGRNKGMGSRRLTHLAGFGIAVPSALVLVLALVPGSLELEDQVFDIGMIVEGLVVEELTVRLLLN